MKEKATALLAETYLASGQHEKAIDTYEKVIEREPFNIRARLALADLLSWEKRYGESIDRYREVLELDPGNIEALTGLARVHTWDGDIEGAERYYTLVVETGRAESDMMLDLGEILVWQGKYDEALDLISRADPEGQSSRGGIITARAFLYAGRYSEAEKAIERVLAGDVGRQDRQDARRALADTYAYSRRYEKAIPLYEDILGETKDVGVKEKLADVLSWDRQYARSVGLYAEILEERYDPKTHRQKARVLGWARLYRDSEIEYLRLLEREYDEGVYLEYSAKKADRAGRVRRAISCYNRLLAKEPRNLEAMFDLAQVYSYRSMWDEAIEVYDRILSESPTHFRAREAREKAALLSGRPSVSSHYRFFRADSVGRETDMKVHEFASGARVPIDKKSFIEAVNMFRIRRYKDHPGINENEGRISFSHMNGPNWRAGGYYGLVGYVYGKNGLAHVFGGDIAARVFDHGEYFFRYDRERLDNNSTVMVRDLYRDSFANRVFLDVTNRLKFSAEYTFSRYPEGNFLNQPAFEILYNISLQPRNLSVRYRYEYRQFRKEADEYFSPTKFSTNTFTLNWRHFLNKEEIFFGADDIYYDLRYDVSLDSEDIVGHKISWEANWDVTKRFNLNVRGSYAGSSAGVYEETDIVAGMRYYF